MVVPAGADLVAAAPSGPAQSVGDAARDPAERHVRLPGAGAVPVMIGDVISNPRRPRQPGAPGLTWDPRGRPPGPHLREA